MKRKRYQQAKGYKQKPIILTNFLIVQTIEKRKKIYSILLKESTRILTYDHCNLIIMKKKSYSDGLKVLGINKSNIKTLTTYNSNRLIVNIHITLHSKRTIMIKKIYPFL